MSKDRELEIRDRRRLIQGIILCVFYYIVLISTIVISEKVEFLEIGGIDIPIDVIQCSCMLIQVMIAILLVVTLRRRGFILSEIFLSVTIIMAIVKIITSGSIDSINGCLISFCGMVVAYEVFLFVRKVENNENELNKLLETDELTGLPNRRAILNMLEYQAACKNKFALIMVNIDNFKVVNDTVGHDYGDVLLKKFTENWPKYLLADYNFFGRSNGDEFAILIDTNDNENVIIEEVEKAIKDKNFKRECILGDVKFFITASAGIAFYPKDADKVSQLLQNADLALSVAKKQGKQGVCAFDKSFIEKLNDSVTIENVIRTALEKQQLFLNFQPQFTSRDKELRGFETLVRLKNEEGNIVSPGVFIPVAEQTVLISQIDAWVLRNAMKSFLPMLKVNSKLILSVNVSVRYLFHEKFLDDIRSNLQQFNFPTQNLELEITESVFISSMDRAVETLKELKNIGIRIALDDFGTGYASMSYINSLPIDMIKIDKTFIDNLADKKGQAFVEAIIAMGHTLNLEVISEGVEDDEQLEILKQLDCNYIQGYLWGKPVGLEKVEKIVNSV